MYYVCKNQNNVPECFYNLDNVDELFDLLGVLTKPLIGELNVSIKLKSYGDVVRVINAEQRYGDINLYVIVDESLYNYTLRYKPGIRSIDEKSSYDMLKDLISEYNILLDTNCLKLLYYSIDHSYAEMKEAVQTIKDHFKDKHTVTKQDLEELFDLNGTLYPRNVLMMYLTMNKWRNTYLQKVLELYGNDITYGAMYKNIKKIFQAKFQYYKTGDGPNYIKKIPLQNVARMYDVFIQNERNFNDITTILNLYEQGGTLNDIVQ